MQKEKKEKPEFKGVKDFILCTNINFDIAELEEKGIKVEEIIDPDDFLDMKNVKKTAIRYKLIVDDTHELYEKLKATSDLYVLAKALVEHIEDKKQINLKRPIFKSYHTALIEEKIIIIEEKEKEKGKKEYIGKFHERFIKYNIQDPNNGPGLSKPAKKLWKILQKHLKITGLSVDTDIEMSLSSAFCKGLDPDPQLNSTNLEEFTQELVSLIKNAKAGEEVIVNKQKKIIKENINKLAGHVLVEKDNKVQCSLTFLDVNSNLRGNLEDFRKKFIEALNKEMIDFDTLNQYQFKINDFYTCEEGQLHFKLPEDYIDNKEIKDFFDVLVFAVNQPNEVELSEIIKDEIGAACNLKNIDLIVANIQTKMLDWFKEKGEKGKEGRFFSDRDGEELFTSTKQQIAKLKLDSSTLEYRAKMKKFGIEFTQDIIQELQLHNFLTAKDERQIFILVTEYNTLSEIKLSQVLQATTEYKEDDSYIFIRLSTLSYIKKLVIEAFKSKSNNLLIIECKEDKSIEEKDIKGIQRELTKVINKKENFNKKIVLITKQDNALTDLFKKYPKKYQEATDNKNSFTDLTTASQEELLQKRKIILQEYKISLHELIDENSKELIDSTTLVKLINNDEVTIGHELISLGDTQNYYMPRTFNYQAVIKTEIFKEEKVLAISDIDEARLGRLVPTDHKISLFQESDLDNSNDIKSIILNNGQAADQFKQLCQHYPDLDIHWLKSESDQLIWQQSQGSVSRLHKFIETGESHTKCYSETELLSQTDQYKVMIISDIAGMGKTTVLTKLSQLIKQQAPELWVVRIDLNNYTKELREQQVKNSFKTEDIDKAIAFLSNDILKLGTLLEQAIFKSYCKKMIVMFDGFDEISPDYRDIVIELVNVLRNSAIKQLWVTTRPNERNILEDKLQQLSYKLKPFSKDNQVNFMTKFWQQTQGLSEVTQEQQERTKDYAVALIDLLTKSIRYKDTELTGIPLQTRMLAEAFEKDFAEEAKLQLPVKLDLTDLYECFLKKKYDIQLEKSKLDISQPNVKAYSGTEYSKFIEKHQNLALYTLFPEDKVEMLLCEKFYQEFSKEYPNLAKKVFRTKNNKKLLFEDKKQELLSFINDIKTSTVNIGIIDQIIEDKPHFIHRTFAEYLVGKFLVASLDNETIVEFVLQEILLQPAYQVTRAFLNGQLPESLPADTLARYGKQIKRLWQSDQKNLYNKEGMTLLHLAAVEGTVKIIRFFLNSLKGQHETILKSLLEATIYVKYFENMTALHLAAARGYLDVVQCLVEHGEANVEATDNDGRTVLHCATEGGTLDVVQWLVTHGKANVKARGNNRRTVLHYAANGNLDIVKWLVEHGKANVKARDNNRRTVLHYAANGNLDVVKWLVEHRKAYVEAKDICGETALHCAARGNLDIVQWLVEHGKADVQAKDEFERTVLHWAVQVNKLDVVQWLVEHGADVNATDIDGKTPLNLAEEEEHTKITEYLSKKIVES